MINLSHVYDDYVTIIHKGSSTLILILVHHDIINRGNPLPSL